MSLARACLWAASLLFLGCKPAAKDDDAGQQHRLAATPSLRLAVITDLQGVLEPCGCTRDSLGGLDRMAHALDELRRDPVPLLVVAAGETWAEEATTTAGHGEPQAAAQASLKARTLAALLEQMRVDVLVPGARDLARTDDVLAGLARARRVALLGTSPREELEGMQPRHELNLSEQPVTLVSDLETLGAARAGSAQRRAPWSSRSLRARLEPKAFRSTCASAVGCWLSTRP
ncbi:MAG TPA: hypothetical protein VMF89_24625, partial [Polyangiales bacterium]|nr:hypothetical protein [Polyangiales bacterium]